MDHIPHKVNLWILITLCSLLGWIIYWVPPAIYRFFSFDGTPWQEAIQNYGVFFMIMELSGAIGMLLRFIGVFLAILVLKEFWPRQVWGHDKNFFDVKNLVSFALVFEAAYYALLLPSGILMVSFNNFQSLASLLLGVDYLLMVFLTVPFLLVLAIKAYRTKPEGFTAWRWSAVTLVAYVTVLWANSVLKWFDRIISEGFSFFSFGINALGALNSLLLMSLALICTVIGAYYLARQKLGSTLKWLGLAFSMIGLHFIIYVLYSYLVGMLSFIVIAEVWAIPLLGLGMSMLNAKSAN
ncbi:MAG: hypothetical protein P8X97_00715 [Candidatus Bathyarchaeota archaeon]